MGVLLTIRVGLLAFGVQICSTWWVIYHVFSKQDDPPFLFEER